MSIEIDEVSAGLAGRLELLQDKGLKRRKQYANRESGDMEISAQTENDFKPALLRYRSKDGRYSDTKPVYFEQPWAVIGKEHLYGTNNATYFVKQDHQTGYGPFNGWVTTLVEIVNGHIVEINAQNATIGKKEIIELDGTRSASWKLVQSASGKGVDIYEVSCDPYANDGPTISYTKYVFDGKDWIKYSRSRKGIWSNEGDNFPNQTYFGETGTKHKRMR